MKIISKYVLREHFGPLMFAFTALTSLMLLNFISKELGELIGKGLPLSIVGQFVLLSIPLTVALTAPMSVLVAVLYVYSRLASENEVTALKASGVSPFRLVAPSIALGIVTSIGMLAFNDQVLPRANHQLKTLTEDISQTKPTLLLKEQVINTVAEGKFYLKAGKIDQALGRLKEVVIYDLSNPTRRRTIYADSGKIAFAPNRIDIDLDLFHGQMQEVASDKPSQLNRLFYGQDRIRIRDVGRDFKKSKATESSKSDREMSICEMQRRLWVAQGGYEASRRIYDDVLHHRTNDVQAIVPTLTPRIPEPHGVGWMYCTLLQKVAGVREAQAADLPSAGLHAVQQDTVTRRGAGLDTITRRGAGPDTGRAKGDTIRPPVTVLPPLPQPATQPGVPQAATVMPGQAPSAGQTQEQIAAAAAAAMMNAKAAAAPERLNIPAPAMNSAAMEAEMRLKMSERSRNRFSIEIYKKFSLAAACLIFCILAPPIALRFPRGGVGLVISVSLIVIAIYYVGLIGGEAAANHGYVQPFWAMWGTNVLMTVVGLIMLVRLRRDFTGTRGGGIREWWDTRKLLRQESRAAASGGMTA